ncbi:ribonuclease P protein component [Streptomonospora nanhaiensis]|uniref:Ribonuclease P protein component n=1 Tax=Streptomonospora nanhaiensis TaxID=1323731 RepID=A0A853BRB0_9ACTN|nr:ribonuclease P protein component [Streptomonospora nanhaiensis]MBV2364097.1 ribonuclease P protein component [Streptomonospora nanhaiensis]MBX9387969.1 ribonuclease P protein component [Streptomonospora nanhaiensis]NYI97097.1 ribonuclease P protein component [Streptomonospora nanhaiensis]
MLSPQNRMRHSAEFGRVLRSGRRAGREALSVAYLAPGPGPHAPPRVGFAVSRAVGNAVVRKRVQRRLRHLMRARLGALPDGSLLVVRAKPLAASLGHDSLAAQLDGAIASAMRPRNATRRRKGPDTPPEPRSGGDRAGS